MIKKIVFICFSSRIHYVEYLVVLVNDNLIDPADIMSSEDLKIVLRREELEPPEEEIGMTNDQYHMLLLNVSVTFNTPSVKSLSKIVWY